MSGDGASLSSMPQYELSLGKTLLDNWVEERMVAHIDNNPKSIKQLHVDGHTGVLTHQTDGVISNATTCRDSYKEPEILKKQKTGTRRELLEKELYEKLSAKIHEELDPPPPSVDYTSTTKSDYQSDYVPMKNEACLPHDVNSEQPVTFWNQNIQQIDGVTQIKNQTAPFKKNAAFSTPIHEYKDSPQPGEQWNF